MKRPINIYAAMFALLVGFCFALTAPEQIEKSSAFVESSEGFLIFAYCKPVKENNYLGTLSVPAIVSDKCDERLKKLISRCKKDFPKADALIITNDFSKADAIQFK